MRYAIFGGTFDPVHIGHLRVAVEAKEHLALDAVLFVPAFVPPHKDSRRVRASAPERLAMLKLAIRHWPFMKIVEFEIRRPTVGYTIDTIDYIRARFGAKNDFFLLVGSDWAGKVSGWRKGPEILRKTRLVVFPRDRRHKLLSGPRSLPSPPLEIASSRIRSLHAGSGTELFIPPAVLAYIRAWGLYGVKAAR